MITLKQVIEDNREQILERISSDSGPSLRLADTFIDEIVEAITYRHPRTGDEPDIIREFEMRYFRDIEDDFKDGCRKLVEEILEKYSR